MSRFLAHAPINERAAVRIRTPAIFDYFSKRVFSDIGACIKKRDNTLLFLGSKIGNNTFLKVSTSYPGGGKVFIFSVSVNGLAENVLKMKY